MLRVLRTRCPVSFPALEPAQGKGARFRVVHSLTLVHMLRPDDVLAVVLCRRWRGFHGGLCLQSPP